MSGPALYDDLIPKADTTSAKPSGLYDDLIPKADSAAAPADTAVDRLNPYHDPEVDSIFADNPEAKKLAAADPHVPQPIERAPAPVESRLNALGPALSGLAHGIVDPFVTTAKRGLHDLLDTGNTGRIAIPFTDKSIALPFDRPSDRDAIIAGTQALATTIAPGVSQEVGQIANPLIRAATRVGLDAGVGALYSPDNPLRGAALGGSIGAAHASVAEGPALKPALQDARIAVGAKIAPELKTQLTEQTQLAQTNVKTGLPNDRAYYRDLPEAEADPNVAVVRMDVNNGKAVNDAPGLGHAYMDKHVLVRAAKAMARAQSEMGPGVRIYHPEGDQFAAFVSPPERAQEFRDLAEQYNGVIEHAPGVKSSLSGGIGATDAEADQAMYVRKAAQKKAQGIVSVRAENQPIAGRRAEGDISGDGQTPEPAQTSDAGVHPVGAAQPSTPVAPAPAPALRSGGVDAPTSATRTGDPTAVDADVQPRLADAQRAASGGLGAEGDGSAGPALEYRNAGLSPISGLGDYAKNALDRTYAKLQHAPNDVAVRTALLDAGVGAAHGLSVAQLGGQYIKAGLAPEDVRAIGAKLTADNIEMVAAGHRAAGDIGAAQVAEAHAARILQDVPEGIEHTAAYQQYVERYREIYEPHYHETSVKGGVPEENFRAVKNGSVYVPLASDQLKEAPVNVVRPASRGSRGTSLSSAAKMATGTGSYTLDPTLAAEKFMPERTKVAAVNDLWQAVRTRGRELGGRDTPIDPGESMVAFNDKNQLTTPESEDARHYVALPNHVAEAVQQFVDESARKGKRGPVNRFLTAATTLASPAIGLTHGGNIAATVNMVPTGTVADVARTVAAAAPFGNTLAGIADLQGVKMTDPATLKTYLAISKHGGTRPLSPTPAEAPSTLKRMAGTVHSDLFGMNGIDVRGRALVAQRLMATNPTMPASEVAEKVAQMFGQYNPTNQPAVVRAGQRTGLTSFAPAGIGFTTQAVKRLTGQAGVGQFVKGVAAPVAGAVALNYAMSGHSPLGNEPGHRGDIDLGEQDADGREKYLKSSYTQPLLNRALNTVGARPLLEGQGPLGAAAGVTNEAAAQLGVVPRMFLGLANTQPRVNSQYNGLEPMAPPQVGDSNKLLQILQQAGAGALGAPAAVAGFSPFDMTQPLSTRLKNATHSNAIGKGRVGGSSEDDSRFSFLQDKMTTAKARVREADTEAKQAEVIATELARARADGYSQDALDIMEAQLQRAAEMSASDRAELREAAMAKRGLTPK